MTATTLDLDAIVNVADAIPGWTRKSELRWLAEQAATRRAILECGCWQGRSTVALALATPGSVDVLDTWVGERDRPEIAGTALYSAWSTHLHAQGVRHKVENYACTFPEFVAQYWDGTPYDLIYLDGDHAEDAVVADCEAALAVAAPYATICGHDWSDNQPGVQQGVRRVFGEPLNPTETIWLAVRP